MFSPFPKYIVSLDRQIVHNHGEAFFTQEPPRDHGLTVYRKFSQRLGYIYKLQWLRENRRPWWRLWYTRGPIERTVRPVRG